MWKNLDTDKQVRQRQAVRRHAQRRHQHFYQTRLDGNFMQNFAAAPIYWGRERWIISAVAFLLSLLAFIVLPGWASVFSNEPSTKPTQPVQLRLPPIVGAPAKPLDNRLALISGNVVALGEASDWMAIKVESGHNLGHIFNSQGFSSAQLMEVLGRMKNAAALTKLQPGEVIGVRGSGVDGRFTGIQFDADNGERVLVNISKNGIVSEQVLTGVTEKRIRIASGVIHGSLFAAADAAGLNDAAILQMAKVFGYDIDFAQDLRKGDYFSVVYEERFRDGERIPGGDILAAVFVNHGKRFDALRFARPGADPEYFDSYGRALRKTFIRTPVEFTLISSRFSSARRHPILGTLRAHRGVDYAAPAGTPIIAAAAGYIVSASWQNGYGNAVVIDHGRGYTTLYGHMSRFAKIAKRGNRVSQGTIIGYVGKTGLATAPHLHYEFRINGIHRDPLKVTMPPPQPLTADLLVSFRRATNSYMTQLALGESRLQPLAVR